MTEPSLPLLQLRLRFCVTNEMIIPPMRSAMWKSAFGEYILQKNLRTGSGCSLYRLLLAPDAEDCILPRSERPAPIVLNTPAQLMLSKKTSWQAVTTQAQPGDGVVLGVTLVGQAAAEVETVVRALDEVASAGIGGGKPRGTARLISVEQFLANGQSKHVDPDAVSTLLAISPAIPPCQNFKVKLAFVQPLRLEIASLPSGKTKAMVMPDQLEASHLASTIVRRVSNLAAAHAGIDIPLDGLRSKLQNLHFFSTRFNLVEQSRFSRSQESTHSCDGIIGTCVLDISNHSWLWPYLVLAQVVHAGKGAVMGMGEIKILPSNE